MERGEWDDRIEIDCSNEAEECRELLPTGSERRVKYGGEEKEIEQLFRSSASFSQIDSATMFPDK